MMSAAKIPIFISAILYLTFSPAKIFACGFCHEDASAGTYDYELRKRIKNQGYELATFRLRCSEPKAAILENLKTNKSVAPWSIRISCDSGTASLGYDPQETNPEEIRNKFNDGQLNTHLSEP